MTLPRLNPFVPDFVADPYRTGARYQAEEPVHWGEAAMSHLPGAWYVFRYADAESVLDDARFCRESARARGDNSGIPVPPQFKEFRALVQNWLVFRDPPHHRRLRSLVTKAFTPMSIDQLRPTITALSQQLIDELQGDEELDLVNTFALPLPVMVIASMLGVAGSDFPEFRRWSLALLDASSSRLKPTPEAFTRAEEASRSFVEYFTREVAARRTSPRDDLISALTRARDEEDRLSDDEIIATCVHLLTSGHETTVNLIAKGVMTLATRPQEIDWMLDQPSRTPRVVEELLRFDSPVQLVTRWAAEDVDLGGKSIRRGELVNVMLGLANRDPLRFSSASEFDPRRGESKHLVFGKGIHFCLGAALARMEGEIAFRQLFLKYPGLQVPNQDIPWTGSLVFHGPKHLKVRLGRSTERNQQRSKP